MFGHTLWVKQGEPRSSVNIEQGLHRAWSRSPARSNWLGQGRSAPSDLLELSPHTPLSLTRTHAGERTKMNSARTRFCRGTPRPPHGLYVGADLMQLDSTPTFTEGKKNWSSPTVWHNSLVKSRFNLHQNAERNKIMFVSFHLLKIYTRNPSLFFISFFTLPPRGKPQCQPRSARDACREVSFAKFLFLPSWFAKLLRANFSYFAKIKWMPSWFAKLLELLLHRHL
jgi:hypothetical protein